MQENYKGYQIYTKWNEKEFGFDFRVCDADGKGIFQSEIPYFYDDNAVKAAKEAIDRRKTEKK